LGDRLQLIITAQSQRCYV